MKYKLRFAAFFTAMIVFNLAANFAHPVTPTVIQELQLHDYMFGVALAVMLITNFLLSPFWGKINNYISSRLSLLICCLGYGVAQVWFAYATTELMIILARMFAGLFTGGIFVSFLTYIVNKSDPEDQGKYLTYSATIKSVASAFGYMIGGFLGEFSVRLAFLVQAGTLIAVAIAFFLICEPDSTANLKDIPAKQLMKEAGYEDTNDDGILEKDGTSLAIHFNYSQSLASVDNAVLSIAASLKELGFDVTIDAVDMNTWYGALMAGEYDLTFYNTAGGSFDPATDMSNMAPGAMGDPILCQFSAFFENPEIFAELDSTSDSQRVQEIYGIILNGIADQNLLVPVTGTHDLALWNTDKITGYDFYTDASYVDIASVHVK